MRKIGGADAIRSGQCLQAELVGIFILKSILDLINDFKAVSLCGTQVYRQLAVNVNKKLLYQ